MKTVESVWSCRAGRLLFLSLLVGLLGIWGAGSAYGANIVSSDAFVTLWKPAGNKIVFPIQGNKVKVLCYEKNGTKPTLSQFQSIPSKDYSYDPSGLAVRNEIKLTYDNKTIEKGKEYIVEIILEGTNALTVKMSGDKENPKASKDLRDILHWGTKSFVGMTQAFWFCENLTKISADDAPTFRPWSNSTNVDINGLFQDCTALSEITNADKWSDKLGNVTNTAYMFSSCKSFNGKGLKSWKLSSVLNVAQMFRGCVSFSEDMSQWGQYLKKCRDFSYMFDGCTSFDGKGLRGVE